MLHFYYHVFIFNAESSMTFSDLPAQTEKFIQ